MATHSSTLAWKIPWAEEPGRLQSMGSLRVGHDWVTSLSFPLLCIGEGNGNPLQCSYLENPRDGGAWWAAIYGVAQSRTQLERLSSSSSKRTFVSWHNLKFHGQEYECDRRGEIGEVPSIPWQTRGWLRRMANKIPESDECLEARLYLDLQPWAKNKVCKNWKPVLYAG